MSVSMALLEKMLCELQSLCDAVRVRASDGSLSPDDLILVRSTLIEVNDVLDLLSEDRQLRAGIEAGSETITSVDQISQDAVRAIDALFAALSRVKDGRPTVV